MTRSAVIACDDASHRLPTRSSPRALRGAASCGDLYSRLVQIGWRVEHPNLSRLADKLNARNSFVDTAPPKA